MRGSDSAAPLNEGKIELFQLIRLNRHEKTQHGGAIAARSPINAVLLPRTPRFLHHLRPLFSFDFTWTTPGGEISRKLYRGRARPVRLVLCCVYSHVRVPDFLTSQLSADRYQVRPRFANRSIFGTAERELRIITAAGERGRIPSNIGKEKILFRSYNCIPARKSRYV